MVVLINRTIHYSRDSGRISREKQQIFTLQNRFLLRNLHLVSRGVYDGITVPSCSLLHSAQWLAIARRKGRPVHDPVLFCLVLFCTRPSLPRSTFHVSSSLPSFILLCPALSLFFLDLATPSSCYLSLLIQCTLLPASLSSCLPHRLYTNSTPRPLPR